MLKASWIISFERTSTVESLFFKNSYRIYDEFTLWNFKCFLAFALWMDFEFPVYASLWNYFVYWISTIIIAWNHFLLKLLPRQCWRGRDDGMKLCIYHLCMSHKINGKNRIRNKDKHGIKMNDINVMCLLLLCVQK